ncbi:hypothetical protein ACFPM7_14840 [Actinokineospora guangxiensis]|uniref:Uncharacterized protein n=1 Tax=Actinokineospora guangxiensis TaxID=1490288 RepID=A0ABW0ES82_9PSEU
MEFAEVRGGTKVAFRMKFLSQEACGAVVFSPVRAGRGQSYERLGTAVAEVAV